MTAVCQCLPVWIHLWIFQCLPLKGETKTVSLFPHTILVFSLSLPFSTSIKHIWTRGSFIFSSIYVPEQETPPTEKYGFLLVLLLHQSRPNALQNMFTPLHTEACLWMWASLVCVLARQQWIECVSDCVTKTIDLEAVSSAFHKYCCWTFHQ